MAIERRAFLAAAGGALAWLAVPAHAAGTPLHYLGGRRMADGRFAVAIADGQGRTIKMIPVPGRCHGFARRPGTTEAVAPARRPGTFCAVFDVSDHHAEANYFQSARGRHFQGHGVFDPSGRTLFTTENDYDKGRGVIGIYDATDGYRRIGEYASRGVGCHELILLKDGRTIAVANGGILTHPDSGRAKLNLPTMAPNLAYIALADGRLLDRFQAPDARRRKLSIRHLAELADGRIAVACQDEGAVGEGLPLVGLHRPGGGPGAFAVLQAPAAAWQAMAGYCGAVAADPAGRLIAASAPRGNRILFWDGATGAPAGELDLVDGCGVAPGPIAGTFAASSGTGIFVTGRRGAKPDGRPDHDGLPWDNHLLAVPA